ncbi:MAG: radical SAM protein [Selenomonadaceae bacterium]|nr:radical SAM protein [Selenomonadaceae bacterium]
MAFSDDCRIYESNGKYLVLNPTLPTWIVTNINGVLLLKLYREDKTFNQIADEFLTYAPYFSKSSLLAFLKKADEARLFHISTDSLSHKPYNLGAVYFNMTEACNLHCIYCFATERKEKIKRMAYRDYVSVLDSIYKINPNAEIMFTGGEPLLFESTLDVARYAKNKGFRCKLMTNGTLINQNNVNDIVDLFVSVRISIDGSSRDIHEQYRGKNTYSKTMSAIDLLLNHNEDVILAMVVTKQNCHDVKAMAQKWGKRLIFQPLFPLGNAKLQKELYLTGEEYFNVLNESGSDFIVPYANLADVIERQKQNQSLLKCAMGDGEISISCSGDVYPCQLLHAEKYCVGNIFNQSLEDIYYSEKLDRFKYHTIHDIDLCRSCDIRLLCGGSCQARHFSETGSIDKAGSFCSYEKKAIINGLIQSAVMQEL